MDGPGGHPEPDRVRGGRGEGSNDDGVSQVHEVFSSILQAQDYYYYHYPILFAKRPPPLRLTNAACQLNPPFTGDRR